MSVRVCDVRHIWRWCCFTVNATAAATLFRVCIAVNKTISQLKSYTIFDEQILWFCRRIETTLNLWNDYVSYFVLFTFLFNLFCKIFIHKIHHFRRKLEKCNCWTQFQTKLIQTENEILNSSRKIENHEHLHRALFNHIEPHAHWFLHIYSFAVSIFRLSLTHFFGVHFVRCHCNMQAQIEILELN